MDVILSSNDASLLKLIETEHYRLVEEWEADGQWFRLERIGQEGQDMQTYRLDEALTLLFDREREAFMDDVTSVLDDDDVDRVDLDDIPF